MAQVPRYVQNTESDSQLYDSIHTGFDGQVDAPADILQVARMIMLIALSFWLCWTPFYAVTAVTQLQKVSFLHESQFLFTMLATHWAGFVNSCLNPLIYAALSNNFRRGFKQVSLLLSLIAKWNRIGRISVQKGRFAGYHKSRYKKSTNNWQNDTKYIYCLHCQIHYYTVRQNKLHPCSFCNNLIKLRSSMPIFCKRLPECICNKTV